MGATLGVSFIIGAKLASSVASAFKSVQSKLQATQAAFASANLQSKKLGKVLDIRHKMDMLQAKMRAEGATPHDLANIQKLAEAYARAARQAGVYGQSLARITWEQNRANAAAARSERTINALNMVQRGRTIRNEQGDHRKDLISKAVADIGPAYALIKPVKIGMEFDASMSKVAAISGATGEAFAALRNQARELGASTVWSAKEAAEGMSFLAMAGFNTEQVMAAMPGMLNLASAGGMDLASTADIASNILTGFKFNADQMTNVGNILAKTFTSSNTSIASLGESFKYCAPVAANAGQAFESVAAMIGKLGDAGIQGSMAGTGLNAIIGRMASPPKEAAAAMGKLGVKVADAAGKMRPMEDVFAEIQRKMGKYSEEQQIALAKALYGAEHFAKGFVLQIASADGSLVKLRDSLHDVDGYSEKVAKIQNDNLAGDFKQLNSAMEEVAICLTDVVTPPLRQLMGHITPLVQSIGVWIKENPRLTQGLFALGSAFIGLKVAGLAFALLNSYRKTFVGGLISMQGQAMRPLALVQNSFSRLRQELTRPMPANTFKGSVQQNFAQFKRRVDSLYQSFGQTIRKMREFDMAAMKTGGQALLSGVKARTGSMIAATSRAGWNTLRLGIRGVGMAFKTMFGPMSLLMMGMSFAADYIIEHWDKIAPYFQALWDNVKAIFASVQGWLEPIFTTISGLFDPFMEKIKSFGGFIGGMLEKIGSAWDWLTGNDTEKKKRAEAQALYEQKKQEQEALIAKLPKSMQAQARAELEGSNKQEASIWAPAGAGKAAVTPPKAAAVPTIAQAREAEKAPPPKAAAEKEAKKAVPKQPQKPDTQIVQPQIQVSVNVTQNGIPEQSFANGVMTAIRNRQNELEGIISGIVNEQARLAYG